METSKKIKDYAQVAFILLGVLFGMFIVTIIFANTNSIGTNLETISTSSSENITATSLTKTFSPVGEGMTSFEAKAYNQTWLDFDGVNDVVDFGKSFNDVKSISIWFKRNHIADNQKFFTNGQYGDYNWTFLITSCGGGSSCVCLANSTSFRVCINETDFNSTDNQWHNVLGNIETMQIYIDGEDYVENNFTSTTSVSGNSKLGCRNSGTHCYNGSIENVKIFSDSLNVDDALNLYLEGVNGNIA